MYNYCVKYKRSIFFAYEWSAPFNNFYKDLIKKYKSVWDVRFGPNIATKPVALGEVEKYRNRNKQLFDIFVKNIHKCSVFIADITTGNPNVMLELGIAIKLNKNILVVSGASKSKTPFNISGVEIEFYKDFKQLTKIIEKHIQMFIRIKDLGFSDKLTGNYFEISSGAEQATEDSITLGTDRARGIAGDFRIIELPLKLEKMRDTSIRVEYRILRKFNDSDWFGFMFRAAENKGAFEPIRNGSILINSRYNGNTDITIYPGLNIVSTAKCNDPHDGINFRKLEIILENERIKICGDDSCFEYDALTNINYGYLYLVCYRNAVEYRNLQIINTDTTVEIT